MKFLVLALCVCAASAAVKPYNAQPWQVPAAAARAVVAPVARAASAAYSGVEQEAQVLRSESNVEADGYNYVYETANGIIAQSSGSLEKVDNVDSLAVKGSYQYSSPDGTPVVVNYIADANGYQPQSDVLPVGPAIPEAILRSIAYNAAHAATEKKF